VSFVFQSAVADSVKLAVGVIFQVNPSPT